MKLKHRVIINIADEDNNTTTLLKAAVVKLPLRLWRFLFGEYRQVYLLDSGKTIDSVHIQEIPGQTEGGDH